MLGHHMLLKPHASINMHHLDKSGDFCAGTMRAIAGFLVLLVVFQTCAFASDLRSGIECNTGRTIHFRVSAGYGYIDDIIIGTEAQLAEKCVTMPRRLSADMMPGHPKSGTKAAMSNLPLWPNGIVPYVRDNSTLSPVQQQQVQDAVNYFNTKTNMRFVPRTIETDYVYFIGVDPNSNFCGASYVGRIGGSQRIELNPHCTDLGTALHEITHALGFLHEHQRSDRDNYITLSPPCPNTTDKEYSDNYGIQPTIPFAGYDLASIMHYGSSSCLAAKPFAQIPISRCENGYGVNNYLVYSIGQRCALSNGDHAALDYFYPAPSVNYIQHAIMQILLYDADAFALTLNIDDSSATTYDASSDGLLILRHLFGFSGASLTTNSLGATARRTDPLAIAAYLNSLGAALDVDNNGRVDGLTDGLLVLRYMLGLRGQSLIVGATGSGANPGTASAVELAIQALMP